MYTTLKWANLALLVLFPLSWFAPLMRAGLAPPFGIAEDSFVGRWMPFVGLNDISIISGMQALWQSDVALALLVTAFALFAPTLKTLGLALIHFGLMRRRVLPVLAWMGKLAMADVFLVALYIVLAKGIGVGAVETSWGLYLFTACILASIVISTLTAKAARPAAAPR